MSGKTQVLGDFTGRKLEVVWDMYERTTLCSRCCGLFNREVGCILGFSKEQAYMSGDGIEVFDAVPDEQCPGVGLYELEFKLKKVEGMKE